MHLLKKEIEKGHIFAKIVPLDFTPKKRLDDHELVHLETKSYKCNQCEFRVKTETGLRLHMKGRHLGITISEEKRALYNARSRKKENKWRTL